jgi:Protein of unknown function (DUF3300)
MKTVLTRALVALLGCALSLPPVLAQPAPPPPPGQGAAQPAGGGAIYKQEELDQMLAPIALYPDPLVAQILMASTYPLDIVEAARWREQNAGLKGDALQSALQQQSWDESVKSLTEFPDVLDRMNKDLAWTQKVGDAFLGQQQQVMDTIQSLRKRAQAAGNLKSNEYQSVETETQENKQVIIIQPANPEIVYVPTYQPTVVYGGWPYPAYPPYYPPYWAPVATPFVSGFFWGVGIAAGAALWGGCAWGRGEVNVNVNRYNNFNRTNINNGNWNHNAERRGNVPYRDNASRQKYGQQNRQAAQSRDQFRGREGSLGGGGLNDRSGLQSAADRGVGQGGGAGAGNRGSQQGGAGANRGGAPSQNLSANRGTGSGGGAFNAGNGAQTRDYSNRGNQSMANRSYGGGGGAGAARGGGGGASRGGGGGGRGGGGRR